LISFYEKISQKYNNIHLNPQNLSFLFYLPASSGNNAFSCSIDLMSFDILSNLGNLIIRRNLHPIATALKSTLLFSYRRERNLLTAL